MTEMMKFKRPRAFLQKMVDRSVRQYQREPRTADIAFLTRLGSVIGRRRWEKQRRDLKYVCETFVNDKDKVKFRYKQRTISVGNFTMKQIDDMCSRHQHQQARKRLVTRYSDIWDFTESDDSDTIERLYVTKSDDSATPVEVGAYIDVYGVAIICIKSGLEYDEFHHHVNWVVRHDQFGPYLFVVVGDGCDEYPRTRRHTCTEGSLSNRLEFGAACSPPRQFPYLSVDDKETGSATVYALNKKELAVSRLRSSLDPDKRIHLNVQLPSNMSKALRALLPVASSTAPALPTASAISRSASSAASTGTVMVSMRVACDYVPIFDLKHFSFCNKNSGTAGLYGGIMYSVDKDHLCLGTRGQLSC